MYIDELNRRLIEAAKAGNYDQLLTLFNIARPENFVSVNLNEPLSWASHNGLTPLVKVLLKNGADVNYKNSQGNTPLHWAAYNAHSDVNQALLNHGADERILDTNMLTSEKFAPFGTHPQVSLMPKVIKDLAQEIAELKTKVQLLESKIAKNSPMGRYHPNSFACSNAQIVNRFGMLKSY